MIVRRRTLSPIDFSGLKIFDYTAGGVVSSSLAVIEVPAGAVHPKAWSSRSDKYYLVVAGSVQFEIDESVTDLDSGDFCLVRQGQRFGYSNPSATPAVLVLVHTPSFDLNAEVFVV